MSTHTRWRRKCRRECIACISAVHPFKAKSCATLLHFAFCVWLYFLLFPTIFILSKSFHDCMSAPRSPRLTPPHLQRILRIVDILHCILTLSVVCRASCLHKTKTNTNPDVVQWDNLCNKILQFVPTYHRRIQPLHCHLIIGSMIFHVMIFHKRWDDERTHSMRPFSHLNAVPTLLHNIKHQEVWGVCVTCVLEIVWITTATLWYRYSWRCHSEFRICSKLCGRGWLRILSNRMSIHNCKWTRMRHENLHICHCQCTRRADEFIRHMRMRNGPANGPDLVKRWPQIIFAAIGFAGTWKMLHLLQWNLFDHLSRDQTAECWNSDPFLVQNPLFLLDCIVSVSCVQAYGRFIVFGLLLRLFYWKHENSQDFADSSLRLGTWRAEGKMNERRMWRMSFWQHLCVCVCVGRMEW